ncbi:MAG: MBL fold metallo-hydrolase [Polyangiaceae bacterium]|nr:MBL fold metallo-hydrolase [Polyangiaceae bacterium]
MKRWCLLAVVSSWMLSAGCSRSPSAPDAEAASGRDGGTIRHADAGPPDSAVDTAPRPADAGKDARPADTVPRPADAGKDARPFAQDAVMAGDGPSDTRAERGPLAGGDARDSAVVDGGGRSDPGKAALKIVSLWVNHGDATVLFLPSGQVALVDTGKTFAVRDFLLPFLKRQGIAQLDYLIITHYHDDHVGGLIKQQDKVYVGDPGGPVDTRVPAKTFWDYNTFKAGDSADLGGVDMFVLNSAHENAQSGENQKSLSFRLERDGFVFTLGADIYAEQQDRILRDYPTKVRCHVYRTNHHMLGSVSRRYLIASDPYVFITSAQEAVYEHDAYTVEFKAAIDYLRDNNKRFIEDLLTLEDGNIFVWANSTDDWGYSKHASGKLIPDFRPNN